MVRSLPLLAGMAYLAQGAICCGSREVELQSGEPGEKAFRGEISLQYPGSCMSSFSSSALVIRNIALCGPKDHYG